MSHSMGDAIFRTLIADHDASEPRADARWVESPRDRDLSIRLSACEISRGSTWPRAMERTLLVDAIVGEVHSWLGPGSARRAPGTGQLWGRTMRRAHREGRVLMAVCRVWRRSVAVNAAFFGRLLVPACDRLATIAELHGRGTTWVTVDGSGTTSRAAAATTVSSRSRSRSRSRSGDENDSSDEDRPGRRRSPLSYAMAGGANARRAPVSASSTVALWAMLRRLPALRVLELTRLTMGARAPSPARLLGGTRLGLRSLCLYKCAGVTADLLGDLVSMCPLLETLEVHHGCPWRRYRRRGLADEEEGEEEEEEDQDDSVAAWIAGASMSATRLRTLRLGDGVDDAALSWVEQFSGSDLCCLNVMHTYACDRLVDSLACALAGPRLLALSLHVDGRAQRCDDVARIVAAAPCARHLKVLALADHVPVSSQARIHDDHAPPSRVPPVDTLTDSGLDALAAGCPSLARLMLDDAGRITVSGVARLIERLACLEQLILRRCFAPRFAGGASLYDLAAARYVRVLWEPRDDQLAFKPPGAPFALSP